MTVPEILEAMMLAAFSIGWYWSISVMLWTRRPYGKSGAFICCTITGYALGLTAQILEWQDGSAFSYLVILYGWNLSMTAVDLTLMICFARNCRAVNKSQVSVARPGGLEIPPGDTALNGVPTGSDPSPRPARIGIGEGYGEGGRS